VADTIKVLPVQIRQLNHIAVDQTEMAYAHGGQLQHRWRTETAQTYDAHLRVYELPLSAIANLVEDDLARVPF
jgi:hypothetical protein